MSDTNTQNRASPLGSARGVPQPLSVILGRVANPLLLFSGSLCALLFLSWMFLLPRFTSVERPDGTAMAPRAIAAYTKKLTAELADAEAHRITLVRAINDPTYRALLDGRAQVLSPLDVERELRQAAARLGEAEGSVIVTSIIVKDSQVTVEGDVRNVGTRSLTVLAAFVDSVKTLPMVRHLTQPVFTRETGPDGFMHSPFHLTFDSSPEL